jgi:hypothetical protein
VRAWRPVLAATALLALTAAGCGGGSEVPTAGGAGSTASSGSPGGAGSRAPEQTKGTSAVSQAPPAGGSGTIVLNGETHAVDQVIRCVVEADLKEGSLDLTALSGGSDLQLLIRVEFTEQLVAVEGDDMEPKVLQAQSLTLQGPAANGLWHSGAAEAVVPPNFSPVWRDDNAEQIDRPPLTIAGDHMSGAVTLGDATGGPGFADLSFEITIPPQAVNCSL